jgi:stage II sporulation protein E
MWRAAIGIRKVRWGTGLGWSLAGGVLGLATLYGRPAPFAWALALASWVDQREGFAWVGLGALVGTVVASGPISAASLALLLAAVPLLGRLRRSPWILGGFGAIGAGVLYAAGLFWREPTPFVAAVVAGVGAAAAVAADRIIRAWHEPLTGGEHLPLALAALAVLLVGLDGLRVGQGFVGLTVGSAVIIAAAQVAEVSGGGLSGLFLALAWAVRGGAPPGLPEWLTVAGLGAGLAARRHIRLAPLGFAAGAVAAVLWVPDVQPTWGMAESMGLGIIAGLFVPESVVAAWRRRLAHPQASGSEAERRLAAMAQAFGAIARTLALPDRAERAVEPNRVALVVREACTGCSLYRVCWEQTFYRSYRGVQDLLLKASERPVGPAHLDADLAFRCIRPERLAEAVNLVAAEARRREEYGRQMAEVQRIAEGQIAAVGRLLAEMAEDLAQPAVAPARPVRRLKARIGVASRPRQGGQVSGDTAVVQQLDADRVLVAVSDGMGVGPKAALESGLAANLVEEVLKAGFSAQVAVKAVNTALLLRSTEERFATLDLAVVDLARREMELVKVAGAPTFLLRGGEVTVFRAESLPVGILHDVRVEPICHRMEPGDVVVLVSDGALGPPATGGEERLMRYLSELPPAPADVAAEMLLSLMLTQTEDVRDDALVLVVQLTDKHGPLPMQVGDRWFGEWQRVTSSVGRQPGRS